MAYLHDNLICKMSNHRVCEFFLTSENLLPTQYEQNHSHSLISEILRADQMPGIVLGTRENNEQDGPNEQSWSQQKRFILVKKTDNK